MSVDDSISYISVSGIRPLLIVSRSYAVRVEYFGERTNELRPNSEYLSYEMRTLWLICKFGLFPISVVIHKRVIWFMRPVQ